MPATQNRQNSGVAKHISATVSQPRKTERRNRQDKDARVRRTRARIDAAFVQLLHRRPYGDIRVGDICRKAVVGRATFYAHYTCKDELLRSQFERIVGPMIIAVPESPALLQATPFFEHVRSVPHIYNALMGPRGGTAPPVLRDCFEARARQALAIEHSARNGLQQFAISRFVAASLLAIIDCWLERGGRDKPHELQLLFANLVSPGVRACRNS